MNEIPIKGEVSADADSARLRFQQLRDYALRYPFRSESWLYQIRQMNCLNHDTRRGEPHHIFGSSVSLKSSDVFTVPLCRECHEDVEAHPAKNYQLIDAWARISHQWISNRLTEFTRMRDATI